MVNCGAMKARLTRGISLAAMAFFCASAQAQVTLGQPNQDWLRTAVNSGTYSDLRWPNFSDYSKHLRKFYDFNGNSLWWVSGMAPTPQARQAIALLQQAGQKGLSAGQSWCCWPGNWACAAARSSSCEARLRPRSGF